MAQYIKIRKQDIGIGSNESDVLIGMNNVSLIRQGDFDYTKMLSFFTIFYESGKAFEFTVFDQTGDPVDVTVWVNAVQKAAIGNPGGAEATVLPIFPAGVTPVKITKIELKGT